MAILIDSSVKKILNNGGFIAALAPELAVVASDGRVRVSAQRLGRVAAIYAKMLSTVGVSVKVTSNWEGCTQAQLLIQWISSEPTTIADAEHKTGLMDKWTAEIWSAIDDLAAGKVPNIG